MMGIFAVVTSVGLPPERVPARRAAPAFPGLRAGRARLFVALLALFFTIAEVPTGTNELERILTDLEGAWRSHDVSRIFRYVGETITLDLGDGRKTYSRDQAYVVLEEYFEKIETISFDIPRKGKRNAVGHHEYRRKGEDEQRSNRVFLNLSESGDSYKLASIRVRGLP